jgi:phosphoenolpyruvate carboxykinase (ATP)
MTNRFTLTQHEINAEVVLRNASPALLYEEAIEYEHGTAIANSGALVVRSGRRTGRSPRDKRIVDHPDSREQVWWGEINISLDEHTFLINRERAIDYLNICDRLYVVDGYAGWDPEYRIRVRLISSRAYHALFMHNLLIRPTVAELEQFGEPDYVIFNAGRFPANKYTTKMTSDTSVDFSLERREIVILGTEYAGEMKKGVFTIMNWLMPSHDVLSMHCSANVGPGLSGKDEVALFFGLSGTGKTTLSADPNRRLIGDDEHCWSAKGIFNIEGGCYAKCIDLSADSEPEIYNAIRFGAVLENVVFDPISRRVDFGSAAITQNTRACYPLDHIPDAVIPAVSAHPSNIIFLTADAFGVLPPVSRLTPEQAMYHFISGYTAKIAGTEQGVTEPVATFSACFGAAFMVRHPGIYARLLAERIRQHNVSVWLVSTGWTGGPHGTGRRIELRYTRAIVHAIHSGALHAALSETDPVFGLEMITECPGVPSEVLRPRETWADTAAYDRKARELAARFADNFAQIQAGLDATVGETSSEIASAGPRV